MLNFTDHRGACRKSTGQWSIGCSSLSPASAGFLRPIQLPKISPAVLHFIKQPSTPTASYPPILLQALLLIRFSTYTVFQLIWFGSSTSQPPEPLSSSVLMTNYILNPTSLNSHLTGVLCWIWNFRCLLGCKPNHFLFLLCHSRYFC